jgi:hypothetical protein
MRSYYLGGGVVSTVFWGKLIARGGKNSLLETSHGLDPDDGSARADQPKAETGRTYSDTE